MYVRTGTGENRPSGEKRATFICTQKKHKAALFRLFCVVRVLTLYNGRKRCPALKVGRLLVVQTVVYFNVTKAAENRAAGPFTPSSSVLALIDPTGTVFLKVAIEDCSNDFENDSDDVSRLPLVFYSVQSSAVGATEELIQKVLRRGLYL